MTKENRRRLSVGWSVALVVVLAAMAAGAGVSSALAVNDPTPSAAPTGASTIASTSPAAGSTPDAARAAADPTATDSASASASATATATDSTSPSDGGSTPTVPPPSPTKCPRCPPNHYVPPDGTLFNHPFVKSSADTIRDHVLRTVKSVPRGGTIRLAEFSLGDDTLVNALIAAVRRGVSVQVVANNHVLTGSLAPTLPASPSFIKLRRVIGDQRARTGVNPERVSFARICSHSCRGTGGNVHYKLFLFSSAGRGSYDPRTGIECPADPPPGSNCPTDKPVARWITMMGSPNLTTMAANGQWNHLDTFSNQQVYDYYMRWFKQMRADQPLKHPYERASFFHGGAQLETWTFPKPNTTASTDPWLQGLKTIKCAGVTGRAGVGGLTRIRVGAYTFYNRRGLWMAKQIRALWDRGCDVAIEYAIMGNAVKKILYSPSGRGRIPMRQVVTFNQLGLIKSYLHEKYITVSGNVGNDTAAYVTWTGTTNISDLGFRSDDSQQVWHSEARYRAYSQEFYTVWRQKQAHVPSPTSQLSIPIGIGRATLGKGKYAKLEPN